MFVALCKLRLQKIMPLLARRRGCTGVPCQKYSRNTSPTYHLLLRTLSALLAPRPLNRARIIISTGTYFKISYPTTNLHRDAALSAAVSSGGHYISSRELVVMLLVLPTRCRPPMNPFQMKDPPLQPVQLR
jgi:hypothetical protein